MNESRKARRTPILAALLLTGIASLASAQTRPVDPTPRPSDLSTATTEPTDFRQKLRDAFANLDLSQDQKLELAGIFQNAQAQAQQLRTDHPDDAPQLQAMRRRHFLEDLRSKTDAVLTPEQRAQVAPAWQSIEPTRDTALATAPAAAPAATTRPTVATIASTQPVATVHPAPTTAPAHAAPPAVVRRPTPRALPRLQAALARLTLTPDQRQQIDTMISNTQQQFAGMNAGDRAAKVKQVTQAVRSKLRDILTPEQLSQLRDSMRAEAAEPPPSAVPPAAASPAAPAVTADTPSQQADPRLIARGTPAPPFALFNLDGDRITLKQFHGRILVLVFGSYTSPVFRDRAAGLQKLWRANEADDKAALFIVYTREAHPTNGWQVDRNKTDHVLLAQTETTESRQAAAAQCKAALHLQIPMLLDSTDDAVSTVYGTFPDGAVVIDRTGTVASAQHWAEPSALQHAINEAARQVATTRP